MLCGGIVDNAARQSHFAAHMGKPRPRLPLPPDLPRSFRRHRLVSSFLIAATSRNMVFESAASGRPGRPSHRLSACRFPPMEVNRPDSTSLSPSRSCPTQLANTSRSPKQRRSTGIGNDRRLHFLAVRFRMSSNGALVGSVVKIRTSLNYAALPHSQLKGGVLSRAEVVYECVCRLLSTGPPEGR